MAFFSSFLLIVVLNSVCVSSIPLWTSDDIFPLIRSKEASSAKRAAANSDLRASDGRAYLRVRVHAGRRLAKEGSGINQRIRFINCKSKWTDHVLYIYCRWSRKVGSRIVTYDLQIPCSIIYFLVFRFISCVCDNMDAFLCIFIVYIVCARKRANVRQTE